ncbi:MAG: transpeptidase family protein [Bacteroidales bacterium]|nr:transpeptidase family protein [Bacteroidales bacterium]
MKDIKRDILWRIYLTYFSVMIFALIVIGKLVLIQIYEGDQLMLKAQKQEMRYFSIDAARGNIFADDGSLLATSIPIFEIRMDVASPLISKAVFNEKIDSLAFCLSRLFKDKSKSEYKRYLQKNRKKNRYLLLKRAATYSELKKLKQFPILRQGKYSGGLIVHQKTRRKLPYSILAKRTIGFENKTKEFFVGIEGAYSDILQGAKGKQLRRRISNGDWKPIHNESEIEPKRGKDIVTSINVNFQDVAENALMRHLEQHKAYQGCAVLMEVETGFVKAIANLQYDSTDKIYKEIYNYAIHESVEPGSTFKLASMLVALDDEKVNLSDTIDTGDGWKVYYNRTMRDAHKIKDGKITCREAFQLSSNVGISKIIYDAYKDHPEKFIEKLYDISLNKSLGIEIAGESNPVIKHPDNKQYWYGTSLPWMSIGYELTLTPLQILTFYNSIANRGKMMKPLFVKEIQQGGKTLEVFEPVLINKSICSSSTIDTLQSLLEGVVEVGTAKRIKNSVYKIAGKTGTAQIANRNQGYDKENYNSTFVGYFPAESPQYSCIVVISKPTAGYYYGSSVAAPVFKEISDKVYANSLNIHYINDEEEIKLSAPLVKTGNQEDLQVFYHDLGFVFDSANSTNEWVASSFYNDKIKLESKNIKTETIPNVMGMSAKDAIFLLESIGLNPKIEGRGIVKHQSIKAGTPVTKGREIILNLKTT